MELQLLDLDTIVNSIIKKSWFNQLKKESLCSIIISMKSIIEEGKISPLFQSDIKLPFIISQDLLTFF